MKPIYQFTAALLFLLFCTIADAGGLKKAYLDSKGNVNVITGEGKHQRLTHEGNVTSLKLAANNETVGWLVKNSWMPPGEKIAGSEELVIYQHEKAVSIKCTPFIRDFWFWQNGSQVAINCGGLHFAGREILYDTGSLREVSSFDEADVPLNSRPDWSNNDE